MTITLDLAASSSDSTTRRTLADLSLSVAKSKRVVVVTGAGISCSCGIPDFRSSDGLYALVKQQYPDVVLKGRDLFDASLFRDATSTAVFYTFISGLKNSIDAASPTPTHQFIKTLDTKGKLLRSYTQNIDGLEERAGLVGSSSGDERVKGKGKAKINTKEVRNVQLHGDIHRVRCTACSAEYPCAKEHLSMFQQGTPPDCPECALRLKARVARSARPIRVGTLRPAIVLYDEPHPLGDEIGTIQSSDLGRRPDLLIIMGTSLKVHGLRKLVKEFAKVVHGDASSGTTSKAKTGKVIFVNKTAPAGEWADVIDYHVAGETDVWTEKVLADWKKARPADWEIQQTLVAATNGLATKDPLKVKKSTTIKEKKGAKKATDRENIPPESFDMVLSTPDAVRTLANRPAKPPLSPSKRAANNEHYDDRQSSPSKRRIAEPSKALEDVDRKLLFKEATNVKATTGPADVFDRSMQDIEHDLADCSMRSLPPTPVKPKVRRITRSSTRVAPAISTKA